MHALCWEWRYTKNKIQRSKRVCPIVWQVTRQMCSHTGDQTALHLHFQGRLPGGGDGRAEPISSHKSKLLGERAGHCNFTVTLQPYPKQPQFLIPADLQQLLLSHRGQGSAYPTDPSCLTANKGTAEYHGCAPPPTQRKINSLSQ